MNGASKGDYAEVNGLNMYYEIHGTGRPLVLLHGAYMTIDALAEIVQELAETRQVIAVRHPELVRKLVVASASYTSEGMHPELLEMIPSLTPEAFAGSPIEEAYLRTAPNPDDFPTLVAKLKRLDMEPFAWPPEDIRGIAAPTLLIIGDSDAIRLEHAVELFRLLGGGVMGDLAGLPKSQLAVLPGTTHFVPPGSAVLDRADWLLSIIPPFLDAPMPEAE